MRVSAVVSRTPQAAEVSGHGLRPSWMICTMSNRASAIAALVQPGIVFTHAQVAGGVGIPGKAVQPHVDWTPAIPRSTLFGAMTKSGPPLSPALALSPAAFVGSV